MLYKIKTDEVCGFINLPLPLGLLELKNNQAEVDIDPTVADRLKALGKISGFSVESLEPEEPVTKEVPEEIEETEELESEKVPEEPEKSEEEIPKKPEKPKKESKTKEVVDKPKRATTAKGRKG